MIEPAERVAAASATGRPQDLHTFLEEYQRDYPDEIVRVHEPIKADWEITALATKLGKAKKFPLLNQALDNKFVDYAIGKLGKYQ